MLCVINRGKSPVSARLFFTLKAAGVWITRWILWTGIGKAVSGQHIRFSFLQRRNAALFFFYALRWKGPNGTRISVLPPPFIPIAALRRWG